MCNDSVDRMPDLAMPSFHPITIDRSDHRRAWLGGFFYGLTGIRPDFSATVVASAIVTDPPPSQAPTNEFPWHDSTLPIRQRMELADGEPIEQRLMAAMAQLDCGSCGYLCHSYSAAIASGEETNLTLCSPGGNDTKRMIKRVLKESGGQPAKKVESTSPKSIGWSRQNPFTAKLIQARPLNKPGSAKDTRHVAIDLSGSGMQYQVGDALGVYPKNCPELVAQIIRTLGANPEQTVRSPLGVIKSLALALLEDCCLKDPSDELLERLKVAAVEQGSDVLDVLLEAGDFSIAAADFVGLLEPLNPRLYSIASSMKQVGDQVHLTVGKVTYQRKGRRRKGVASTMLAERVQYGERVRVFIQPNHRGFSVPQNTTAPMIMVGPGTGIAPFIAFLQERHATAAPGRNWLFFGDQHQATDFLYQEILRKHVENGLLTRLETAFSRDGSKQIYVQDRMREHAAELWGWLQEGAYFYVCGDASRMANDVQQTLIQIVAEQGAMSHDAAKVYVDKLSSDERYVRDVY